jgi:hypothetical protein
LAGRALSVTTELCANSAVQLVPPVPQVIPVELTVPVPVLVTLRRQTPSPLTASPTEPPGSAVNVRFPLSIPPCSGRNLVVIEHVPPGASAAVQVLVVTMKSLVLLLASDGTPVAACPVFVTVQVNVDDDRNSTSVAPKSWGVASLAS